jgi:hypothetical protein
MDGKASFMLFPFFMNSHGTLPIENGRSSFRASLMKVPNTSGWAALVGIAKSDQLGCTAHTAGVILLVSKISASWRRADGKCGGPTVTLYVPAFSMSKGCSRGMPLGNPQEFDKRGLPSEREIVRPQSLCCFSEEDNICILSVQRTITSSATVGISLEERLHEADVA